MIVYNLWYLLFLLQMLVVGARNEYPQFYVLEPKYEKAILNARFNQKYNY